MTPPRVDRATDIDVSLYLFIRYSHGDCAVTPIYTLRLVARVCECTRVYVCVCCVCMAHRLTPPSRSSVAQRTMSNGVFVRSHSVFTFYESPFLTARRYSTKYVVDRLRELVIIVIRPPLPTIGDVTATAVAAASCLPVPHSIIQLPPPYTRASLIRPSLPVATFPLRAARRPTCLLIGSTGTNPKGIVRVGKGGAIGYGGYRRMLTNGTTFSLSFSLSLSLSFSLLSYCYLSHQAILSYARTQIHEPFVPVRIQI